MRVILAVLQCCLIVVLAAQGAWAAERTVGPGVGYDFDNIQDALDASSNGDTVTVEAGTYTGSKNRNLDFGGKSIILQSDDGADMCTIDVQSINGNRAFLFNDGETSGAKVIGFTIHDGHIVSAGDGGAIRCVGSSPTIQDCIFTENRAEGHGGAIYLDSSSSPTITGCEFTGNIATGFGAAVGNGGAIAMEDGCNPTIFDCTFDSNEAATNGGAIWISGNSDPVIDSCRLWNNEAGDQGGGIFNGGDNSSPTITHCFIFLNAATVGGGVNVDDATVVLRNCLLESNEATGNGGGARVSNGGSLTVQGCTVYNNQAGTDASGEGGGFYVTGASSALTVTNSILWTNDDDGGADQITLASSPTVSVNDSCVQGGYSGSGNISTDPDLLTHSSGDELNGLHFHIDTDSPCIDTGDDAWGTWDFDIDEEDRTQDTDQDMGVDEV